MGLSGGQFDKLGLPHEIGYKFTADTAAILPGVTPHAEKRHRWAKRVTIDELNPVYRQFMSRVNGYIEELMEEISRVSSNKINGAVADEDLE